MSRPHVRLIGTLLLLTIRASSSSVSRRLSNDDFFQFFGSPSNSTEGFVPIDYTDAIPATTSRVPSANIIHQIQSSHWREENLVYPNVAERNLSYLVESSSPLFSVNQPLMNSSLEQPRERRKKKSYIPWYLTYSRSKENSSRENVITNRNSSIFGNLFEENSHQHQTQKTLLQIPIDDTQSVSRAPTEDRIHVNNSQLPTGFRISRRRRQSSSDSHNLYMNGLSNIRPTSNATGIEITSRRRYPRYQLQSLYPSIQEENLRWPGHPLSQDPNYHPIKDARPGTRPIIQSQTSFVSPYQARPQSAAQQQNSMQQYLWSLYEAQNEARQPEHENSKSDSDSQYALNSRYSTSLGEQVAVLTPTPPHVVKYDSQRHRPETSGQLENSRSVTSQSIHENSIEDFSQSQSDKSWASHQDDRNFRNSANNIVELTTGAPGNGGESNSHSQEPISALDHNEEDDDDSAENISTSVSDVTNLRVGKSLNIFSRYGFLTLSIKVRPPVGVDNYLFMENTAEVFQRNSYWSKRERRRHTGRFDDHFYIHFCENLNELLIAYFDHFTIEGVPKAHKAFTASLSLRDLARQFGINSSFLRGRFSFVLVRLFRRKMRKTLKGPHTMQTALDAALRAVRIGSEESVHRFVDRFGTHVIKEFEVGDMMYQTFVFGERIYKQLKNTFVTVGSESHLEQLQLYFSPRFATNVGTIQLASGNSKLTTILEGWSVIPEQILYPTIFKVFDDPAVETELEQLDGEVVLSLKLDKITTRLPPTAATRWMSEVLDNSLALYYHNLDSTRDTT